MFLEPQAEGNEEELHRAAALSGMDVLHGRQEPRGAHLSIETVEIQEPVSCAWDVSKLTGHRIALSTFWGTDDVIPKAIGDQREGYRAWSIPNVDGYKTAFFLPPYNLYGTLDEQMEAFDGINRFVLGLEPERATIFSWSTNWSSYFDAGHEWWGTFYWTIRPVGLPWMVVVAASTTD